MIFGKNSEQEPAATTEKTYTKAEIMAALSTVETPYDGENGDEMNDSIAVKTALCGARLLAETLLDGLTVDAAHKKMAVDIFRISIESILLDRKSEGGARGVGSL